MSDPATSRDRSGKEIFFEALERPTPQERAAFLDEACGKNPEQRAKVEALLADHFQHDSFMKEPAAEAPARTVPLAPPVEAPAQMLGRYKLLEKLGEGGFGEVWMAEQREPVKRRVALKIIKLGMDSRQIVARFEAERQALAMMDHANIAKIFDAGTTDAGRPYFVMELVRGIKITEYCDQNQLPTKERLNLFIKVCQAIQHAHQKGIIHRDLKPSNILVTLHDGVPVPKVIDFGIAKATQQELTDKTVFTQFQQFIGTPAYISPEQAEMSGLDIDTRSDIYSLGVLLYELLVGQTPFDAKEMMKGGVDALRKIIREQEPMRPSTRLNTLPGDARTTAGKRRQTDSVKLVHQLQGDLDWIAMKCLEKDRTRRYDTATALAADIQRHLNNEPVIARPPSPAYKIQKAWQRNKLAFTAATAVAAALAIGMGASLWQAARATAARNDAERTGQEAIASAAAAQKERDKAEAATYQAQLHRYVSDVGIAYHLLMEGSVTRAVELLRQHIPATPGQPEFRGFEWHYVWRLCQGDALATSPPQRFPLESVSVSSDGQWIATTSSRGEAGFSPWLRTSASQPPGEVTIFAAQSLQPVATSATDLSTPTAVAFFPSEHALLVGHANGSISRWSGGLFGQGERLAGSHSNSVRSIVFSPAGDLFATGGLDGRVLLWRTADRALVWDENIGWPVWDAAFSTDGRRLAVAGRSEEVLFVDLETRSRKTNGLSAGWVTCLAFSPKTPELLIMGRMNSRLMGLNTSSGDSFVLGKHEASVTDVEFLPDGTTLVSSGLDQSIRMWDVESWRPLGLLKGHTDTAWQVASSRTGRKVYSASADRTLKSWEADNPQEFDLLHRGTNWVFGLEFSGNGRWLAGSVWDHSLPDRSLHLWDVPSQSEVGHHRLSVNGLIRGLAFDRPRHRIIVGSFDGMVEVWDARLRQADRVFQAHARDLYCLTISPDGRFLATATGGRTPGVAKGELRLWDADTCQPASDPVLINDTGISVLAFTPDGRTLALGSPDGSVTLVEIPSARRFAQAQGHFNPVFSIAVSSDGKRLATGSLDDSLVRLWDLEPLRWVADFPCVSGTVYSLIFAQDGRSLIAGYGNGKIRFWNLESHREALALDAHDAFIPGLALAPDGMTLASGSADGSIKLWPSKRYRRRDSEVVR